MDKLKRAIHIDFHTMPGIYDFGSNFDPAAFAETLSEAKVTMINAFARCNIGFSYYKTEVGIPYPEMKTDLLGDIIRECHKRGVKVVAYVNAGLNHEFAFRHPEWCRLDSEGRVIRGDRSGNFFRTMCYNSGYGKHLLAETHEIVNNYDVDGMFFDCMVLQPCLCPACVEGMKNEGVNIDNLSEVTEFSRRVMYGMGRRLKAELPEGKLCFLNSIDFDRVDDIDTHAEIECLPSGGWGYDFFVPTSAYVRNLKKELLYMTGRFQSSWGDFGGLKPKASIENDMFDSLCQGTGFSVGDHMHPSRGLEKRLYDIVKELYTRLEEYEKWTDNAEYLPEIGILINRGRGMGEAYRGAARMLSELKYNFDIVNEDGDINRFKLLILPDCLDMTKFSKDKFRKYLDNGGKILSAGKSPLNMEKTGFMFKEWDFLTFEGIDSSLSSYYMLPDSDFRFATYAKSGVFIRADSADTIAEYVKPYFERHWDGIHGYFYTPPEKKTGNAVAAVKNNIGAVSFDIFAAYNRQSYVEHKRLVRSVIEKLLPDPLIKADGMPATSRVTLTGNMAYKLLHIKVTYPEKRGSYDIIEEHNVLPANRTIAVKGSYKAFLLPSEKPVSVAEENGYTLLTLPEITGYAMLLLKP